jgi:FkbM family methyltransferase
MRKVPLRIQYTAGMQQREKRLPYSLVKPGSIIVQVGAPQDTLHSGRSRGMYFSLFAGNTGKVVLVEPDTVSLAEYLDVAKRLGMLNLVFCPTALWSERKKLRVFVNDAHPASSFTEGTKEYDDEILKQYRQIELQADTLDNVLKESGIEKVDLVSITTNGAEKEILIGMKQIISRGVPFICLAKTGSNYVEMMTTLGYELIAYDDRGYTFRQVG